jgi:hypothetical protein
VPETVQAALVVSLLIAPGYVLIQGYRQGRSWTPPDKDLYVLAQAVVGSLGWLAFVGVVLSFYGSPLKDLGLLPQNAAIVERHLAAVSLLVFGIELLPFPLGVVVGLIVNALQGVDRAYALLRWTGIFEPPTAWEQAWSEAVARAEGSSAQRPIEVQVLLKSGIVIEGRYGSASRADLSPRPGHQLYLETGYGVDERSGEPQLLGDGTIGGVFIDASEIATVYFKS